MVIGRQHRRTVESWETWRGSPRTNWQGSSLPAPTRATPRLRPGGRGRSSVSGQPVDAGSRRAGRLVTAAACEGDEGVEGGVGIAVGAAPSKGEQGATGQVGPPCGSSGTRCAWGGRGSARLFREERQLEGDLSAACSLSRAGTRRDHIRPGLRVIGFEARVAIAFHVGAEKVTIDRILYGGRDLGTAFPEM